MQSDTQRAPVLSMEGVDIAFSGKKALENLSFSVREGEIFGFLGPSGAGKTTTIKLLTRQLRADAGDIRLFGEDIQAQKQSVFDQIGVLTDNSGLYERLSVYDNLLLFAKLHKLPATVVEEALEQVGLGKDADLGPEAPQNGGKKRQIRDQAAKTLSRGMKQRLMLARAVLNKPRLLFLDEPTAALDPGTSQQIHKLLQALNKGGTTIFLTTHNMEEADKLCHRVAFLNHGHIVACDNPEALKLSHARNVLVARLKSGAVHTVSKDAAGLSTLLPLVESDPLVTLHSQEPNLEDIFLQMTGRDLA